MNQAIDNNIQLDKPILSICIPIYNRLSFLQKMLERFMEDKNLFEKEIELIISDNCSEENLETCVKSYQKRLLPIFYYRQTSNLGPDGNFNYCFHKASGKYMWLLGSDDIPLKGILPLLMSYLRNSDFGLFHFRAPSDGKTYYKDYYDNNNILVDINVQITFMSANIIRTDRLSRLDLLKYAGTNLIQVPAFMDACLSAPKNAICLIPEIFEPIFDEAHTGDYDLFGVMVKNLFTICQEFVDDGRLRKKEFLKFKRAEFDWISAVIIAYLFLKRKNNYILKNAWGNLFKFYGKDLYSYVRFIYISSKILFRKIFRSI
ncbi:MAG: glycosyltransferase family 2 protein [Bacteroidales bacterium]|nr:glycosyltransferase family 2 protein [Bacteroidales bacterium]